MSFTTTVHRSLRICAACHHSLLPKTDAWVVLALRADSSLMTLSCVLCCVLQMRTAVRKVAGLFPTSIISGRGREKVEGFVQLKELFYAGSHGMDIVGPKVNYTSQTPDSASYLICVDRVIRTLHMCSASRHTP